MPESGSDCDPFPTCEYVVQGIEEGEVANKSPLHSEHCCEVLECIPGAGKCKRVKRMRVP